MGYDINTAGMLRNLLRDNTFIVDRVGEENIQYFLGWLVKQKNPDFLDFLGVLCVCEGRGMPQNQTKIMNKIILTLEKHSILLTSKVVDGVLQIQDRGATAWVPATEFVKDEVVRFFFFFMIYFYFYFYF